MKKVAIIGHFAFGKNSLNGQTVKTKIITEELEKNFGEEEVLKIDTYGGKKTLLKSPFQTFSAFKKSKNIIILPAHNGIRIYGRFLPFFKKFFKGRKIHYVVIGAWLPQLLKNKPRLAKKLKQFDGVYVETNTLKNALEEQGFDNIILFPNCKNLTPVFVSDLEYNQKEPFKLCTFSRVTKEKGIGDAVKLVEEINQESGRVVFSLDIYGQIDSSQVEWFEILQKDFPDYIRYCGCVPFDKSVETLKSYFALLFPTHYYTEGIPGTIIDAYAAGVPVISSKWESFADVIDDGSTGIGFNFNDNIDFKRILLELVDNPKRIENLKENCLKRSEDFSTENVIRKFIECLS